MTLSIDKNITLELMSVSHALPLYEAVDNNRQHLAEFLPWINEMQSPADFQQHIKNCELLYRQKKEVSFVIITNGAAIGRIGLHHLNLQNRNAAIGYWLTKDWQGKGIITRSCKNLLTYGFEELGLHRIEIKAAVGNLKSQAIPKKLNFKKEGILREAECVNGKFLDLVLYSVLKDEWNEPQG